VEQILCPNFGTAVDRKIASNRDLLPEDGSLYGLPPNEISIGS